MYGFFGLIVLVAIAASGCAKKATPPRPSISQAAFYRVDYTTWACPELMQEANLLADALEVEKEGQPGTQTTERVKSISRSEKAVRQELAIKGCRVSSSD